MTYVFQHRDRPTIASPKLPATGFCLRGIIISVPHDIETILRAIPGFSSAARATPLTGGITNRNYRVEDGGDVFVLRIAGENTAQLGIDRQREHDCARLAARLGIGAEVIAYLPEYTALVTRFLPGKVLCPGAALPDPALARAAAAIKRLHTAPTIPGSFSAFTTIRDYDQLAQSTGVLLPGGVAPALEELSNIEASVDEGNESCPCHNDLLPGNLIDDGQAVRIIDWEYAGTGNRFFDLGNFAENHRLARGQEVQFLAHYFGVVRPADLVRLHTWRRVSALREAMWGFAQIGISQLDFDFASYAAEHLGRFSLPIQD